MPVMYISRRLDSMYYTLGKKSQPTPLQDWFETPLATQFSQIFLGPVPSKSCLGYRDKEQPASKCGL